MNTTRIAGNKTDEMISREDSVCGVLSVQITQHERALAECVCGESDVVCVGPWKENPTPIPKLSAFRPCPRFFLAINLRMTWAA